MFENAESINSQLGGVFVEIHNDNQINLEHVNLIMLSFQGKDMSTPNITEFIKNKINMLNDTKNKLIEMYSKTKEKIDWLNNSEFASIKDDNSKDLINKIENLLNDNIKIQEMASGLISELNKLV